MNILAPLAAGLALAPKAVKMLGGLAQELSFSSLLSQPTADSDDAAKIAAQQAATAKIDEFRQELQDWLSVAGVDLSEPITLGINSWGQIEVRSPHHQAFEIEQLISGNSEMKYGFQQVAAMASVSSSGSQLASSLTADLDQFELTLGG